MWHDLRQSLRSNFAGSARRAAVAAVPTLTIAIAAVVTAMSLADAILLRTLPCPAADRMVNVLLGPDPSVLRSHVASVSDYGAWAPRARWFDMLAGFQTLPTMWKRPGQTRRAARADPLEVLRET